MASAAERVVVTRPIVVVRIPFVVMAQITVVLKQVHQHLGHTHPLVQVHGTEAIEPEDEEKKQAAHGEAKVGSLNGKRSTGVTRRMRGPCPDRSC